MWVVIAMIVLLVISIVLAISTTKKTEQIEYLINKQQEPYNTMYIDHQHKLIQMKIKGKVSEEQVESIESTMQSYIDDGYKVLVFDDSFSLRIETD